MTTLEATRVLGFHTASGGVIDALRKAGVQEIGSSGAGSGRSGRHGRCLWRREQVETLAKEREHVAWLKANGFKFCVGCEEWKVRQSQFAPSAHRCRECMTKFNKATWAEGKRERSRRLSGSVETYVGHIKPAAPADALQYACMDVGYHHRPIPRGQRKREVYCTTCTAKRCMFHRELTPKELVERWKKWGR